VKIDRRNSAKDRGGVPAVEVEERETKRCIELPSLEGNLPIKNHFTPTLRNIKKERGDGVTIMRKEKIPGLTIFERRGNHGNRKGKKNKNLKVRAPAHVGSCGAKKTPCRESSLGTGRGGVPPRATSSAQQKSALRGTGKRSRPEKESSGES